VNIPSSETKERTDAPVPAQRDPARRRAAGARRARADHGRPARAAREDDRAGQWVFTSHLHPASAATVVRHQDGETLLTDGPFAEANEHVGGFTVIDVPDLDAALAWAAGMAKASTLPIEVRPMAG
jgi:hypothetical protein